MRIDNKETFSSNEISIVTKTGIYRLVECENGQLLIESKSGLVNASLERGRCVYLRTDGDFS